MAGYSHRTAQPPILAVFLPWGSSAGAGRVRPAAANVGQIEGLKKLQKTSLIYHCCLELMVENPTKLGYLAPACV